MAGVSLTFHGWKGPGGAPEASEFAPKDWAGLALDRWTASRPTPERPFVERSELPRLGAATPISVRNP
jgi:hypothetical protein